ncbi:hypothetical protein [Verrucosispora sp. NA02020]|uniref:hypothetical protein n=1 Tax=Verrucosispora sp. NA02020 TaxID=2742132 RepID=UPI001590EB37|nr:hypothetical protein [Verrucosispora sp. NA02020]QKW15439.1 hypothetical protein HUT12_23505 [Verrucosispora sp. NA02020]
MTDPKPMTGPEHVCEALRLAALADQKDHLLPGGNGTYNPTDAQRDRWLMRAHLHANLARTAAMVDTYRYSDTGEIRSQSSRNAWHEVFAVGVDR